MSTLLHAARVRERLVRAWAQGRRGTESSAAGRRFRITGDSIVADDDAGIAGGDVIAVPTEDVLLLHARLPTGSYRRRAEAAGFAIEDRIADPLERVHVAIGPEIAPMLFLVAVVRHTVMQRWTEAARAHGLSGAALVPDALLLAQPSEGQWAVSVARDRALVRCGDGTGFAASLTQLPQLWLAAGRPDCVALSAGVPELLTPAGDDRSTALAIRPAAPIDLRQGRYAARRRAISPLRRRVAIVAVAGVFAHGAIAAVDTLALSHQAQVRDGETRALLAAAQIGVPPQTDAPLDALANLPAPRTSANPDKLLPILSRISAAIGQTTLKKIDYDRQARRLILYAEPGSIAALAQSLATAGFTVRTAADRVDVTGLET